MGDTSSEILLLKDCMGNKDQPTETQRSQTANLDFLERLEKAERRDQEALETARESEAMALQRRLVAADVLSRRSPRDSPRGDCKRRATRAGKTIPKAQPLVNEQNDAKLHEMLQVIDLDKLNLDEFTLEELIASPQEMCPPNQFVDEMMELVCKEMESPRWSDFDYDGSVLADCHC